MQLFFEFGGHRDFSDYMGTNAQRGGGKVFCLKSTARPSFPYGDERKMARKKPQQTHNRLHGKAAKTANFCRFLLRGLVLSLQSKKKRTQKKDRTSGKESNRERSRRVRGAGILSGERLAGWPSALTVWHAGKLCSTEIIAALIISKKKSCVYCLAEIASCYNLFF